MGFEGLGSDGIGVVGEQGGYVIATGTPEQVAQVKSVDGVWGEVERKPKRPKILWEVLKVKLVVCIDIGE